MQTGVTRMASSGTAGNTENQPLIWFPKTTDQLKHLEGQNVIIFWTDPQYDVRTYKYYGNRDGNKEVGMFHGTYDPMTDLSNRDEATYSPIAWETAIKEIAVIASWDEGMVFRQLCGDYLEDRYLEAR